MTLLLSQKKLYLHLYKSISKMIKIVERTYYVIFVKLIKFIYGSFPRANKGLNNLELILYNFSNSECTHKSTVLKENE